MKSYRILLIKKPVDFIRPHFLTFPEIRKDENINKCKTTVYMISCLTVKECQ